MVVKIPRSFRLSAVNRITPAHCFSETMICGGSGFPNEYSVSDHLGSKGKKAGREALTIVSFNGYCVCLSKVFLVDG